MRTSTCCSWCHEVNVVGAAGWPACSSCGHRADVARVDCDCGRCARSTAAAGERVDLLGVRVTPRAPDAATAFAGYVEALEEVSRLAAELLLPGDHGGVRRDVRGALDRVALAALNVGVALDAEARWRRRG